uniref:Uncharacterized protein n=1 Tax=Populus alba TaxID=43335 RepID=A0A4U5P452_POPAL|nr:hypothetical protein D5086_0000227640 [Populus alba]
MQNLFRFRELSEFDDKKRIDQNARRRKPQPEAIWFSSARPSSSFYGATSISKGLLKKHGSYLPTPCADELAILGAPMDPEDLTNQIMDGLDDDYKELIYGSVAIQSAAEGRSIEMAGGVVEGSQSAVSTRCRLCWGRRENRGGDGERRPGEEKEMGLRWIFEGRPVLKGSRFDSVLVVCY